MATSIFKRRFIVKSTRVMVIGCLLAIVLITGLLFGGAVMRQRYVVKEQNKVSFIKLAADLHRSFTRSALLAESLQNDITWDKVAHIQIFLREEIEHIKDSYHRILDNYIFIQIEEGGASALETILFSKPNLLDASIAEYLATLQSIANAAPQKIMLDQTSIRAIDEIARNTHLEKGLDALVNEYEHRVQRGMMWIEKLDKAILWAHLGALVIICCCVFYPMIRTIRLTIRELNQINEELEKQKDELNETHNAMLSVMEDIDLARTKAEEAKNAVYRLAAIVTSSDDAIIAINLDGIITEWNKGAEFMYGYTFEEAIGKHISKLIPEYKREELESIMQLLRKGEGIKNVETIRRTKEGNLLDVSLTISPIYDAEGHSIGASSIARDITERRRAEDKFRLAVEAAPNGMILVKATGEIALVNKTAEMMFGYSREEIVGDSIEMLVPEEYRSVHVKYCDQFIKENRSRAMGFTGQQLYGLHKNMSRFPIEVGLTPIKIQNQKYVLAGIVDITERKRNEQKIEEYTQELKRSNADLEQFAYIASHDLKSPLNLIINYLDLLKKALPTKITGNAKKSIEGAVKAAQRMNRMIGDLLRYSKVSQKGLEIKKTSCQNVVETACDILKAEIEKYHAKIKCSQLPELYVDEGLMIQVFQNIIWNAIKYRGKSSPEINIDSQEQGNAWIISIVDNGIGIEEKYLEKIFEIFQRLPQQDQSPGSGIGLSLCKKIVESHNGKIWAQSQPGKGTTFHMQIPKVLHGALEEKGA